MRRQLRSDRRVWWEIDKLQGWAERRGIRLEFIQPVCPQQNAYVERYNLTVRYEWLAQYLFDSIEEVQKFATKWLWTYNHERPNMGLGGITPKQKLALAAWFLLFERVKKGDYLGLAFNKLLR